MKLLKILVHEDEHAVEILSLLEEGEANGMLDFPFSVRLTEELSYSEAKHNLMNEELS